MRRALVLGTSDGAVADKATALSLFEPDVIIGVNHAGLLFPEMTHWASCHTELFDGWIEKRETLGMPRCQIWTDDGKMAYDRAVVARLGAICVPYWEGSSGALGIGVAQALRCDRIVIAGMPLTSTSHFYDTSVFNYATLYQRKWSANRDKLCNVRSVSGWTAAFLGFPDAKWLEGDL